MDFNVKDLIEYARRGETQLAQVAEKTIREEAIPLAVTPDGDGGASLVNLKPLLDAWRTAPERREGTAQAKTLESFIELTKRHADENSAIFADIVSAEPALTAVIDYHKMTSEPRFCKHRVTYKYPVSDEWTAWRSHNTKQLAQIEFAAFIEDHVADLAAPTDAEKAQIERLFQTKIALPSELVQLSRGLALSVDTKVKEIRTLQSGEAQITYEEVHKDGAGQPLVIPGLFVINIPLFVGADPTRLIARLRYRRDNGLKWSFHFWRWREDMRAHLENDLDAIRKETALPVYEGSPEA
jgi:uncharacterized protein YfdQ (DUF2303 family)